MKKLLTFITFIFLFGCTVNFEDSKIENPKETTTLQIQENIIDSCAILCTDGQYVYIMDDTNEAQYKLAPINNKVVIVNNAFIFIFLFLSFFFVIVVIRALTTD